MEFPQKKAKNTPAIRKGPKGTSLLIVFFFIAIKASPMTAPDQKAKNIATIILGQPKNNPIKRASFTSPKPSQAPFEIKNIIRKNKIAPMPAKIELKEKNKRL